MTRPPEPPDSDAPPPDVTPLLLAWGSGDKAAGEKLLPAIYAELHRQASRAMRRESDEHTLQATALVHEAYLRLVDQRRAEWHNRAQFFGVAAQVMRRILVDHARAQHATKRGGAMQQITLGDATQTAASHADDSALDVLALHDALDRLAAMDPEQAPGADAFTDLRLGESGVKHLNARYEPVLHGIEVNIIDMTLHVRVITNGVLPIAALPDAFFPF